MTFTTPYITFICDSSDTTVLGDSDISGSCKTLKDKILSLTSENNDNKSTDQLFE